VQDKKYQIFVSSTYTDLIEARNKAIEIILNMYHIPIGMEMFSAADDEQWGVIKDTIDISDYYIVIIGHRYGSETPEGISYTEKEYNYAKEKGIPIMAFLREEGVATKPNEREDNPDKIKKLNAFRDKATKNKMCDFWENKDQLANKIALALMKEFNRSPRTGWIRADKAISPEMSKEMAELSKENRELREEVSKLKSQLTEDKPRIGISFDGEEKLKINFDEFTNYLKLDKILFQEIPNYLKKYMNEEDVEFYNNNLPSKTEVDNYNDKKELYWRKTEVNKDLNITIINDGSKKANEVYVDIKFPKEGLLIMEKYDVEQLRSPELPDIPENPLKKAKKEYNESLMGKNILSGFGNTVFNPGFSNFDVPTPYIPTPNPHYSTRVENNKIIIWIDNILHTRSKKFEDEFVIIPLKRGDFTIEISIICEEYTEEDVIYLPMSIV